MSETHKDEHYTQDFAEVRAAEIEWIRRRRSAAGPLPDTAPLVGLALSGGGIRSASFNLGVLQALARSGLLSRIDYLSSVSGGGYTASCFAWLRTQLGASGPADPTAAPLARSPGDVLAWIRAHGRYLITGRGLSGWSLAASIAAGTLLNLFVLLPLFLFLIGLASRDWFALAWPSELRFPGAPAVPAHDGFMLIAISSGIAFALYLCAMLLFALSTALPATRRMAAEYYFRRRLGQLLAWSVIAFAVGMLPVLTGIEESVALLLRRQAMEGVTMHFTWLAPMAAGAAAVWRAARSVAGSRALAIAGLGLLLYGGFTGLYHLAHHTTLLAMPAFHYWLIASLTLACLCDINALSMHSYYRSRLALAFLPAVRRADSSREKEAHPMLFRLTDIGPDSGAPFPIINTTLNTTSSSNPTLRSRNGESMPLTPLYCGSASTGYRRTTNYLNGELTLSTAFAISGAAVDPDMYATRARPISFLMTLLNVRLGYWTFNPRKTPRGFYLPAWYQLMLREMLGRGLSESEARIHLADGGHFDNLGVYELLRRRCRYIIVSDAGEDAAVTLADLGQVVQRARADFGVEVEICADDFFHARNTALHTQVHLLGSIRYPDGDTGQILYLKALLREHLSADIYAYWRLNPAFPNQPTSNQFFGELQFDSYRELGLQLMSGIIADAPSATIEGLFAERAREDAGLEQLGLERARA